MSATNAKEQKTTLDSLTKYFGQEKVLELPDLYEKNYFTEDDMDRCASLGMSAVLIPFSYMNLLRLDEDEKCLGNQRL